jgi:heterodisulfide reductase subunit A-like polyferredoxin
MEMQQVRSGNYFDGLKALGVSFIKCRPVKVEVRNHEAEVVFDNPETGVREKLMFDLVVLSDGIRPADDAARVAEVFGFGQTEDGFLRYVKDSGDAKDTGVYIAGCVGGPAKIEEVYAEAVSVAKQICGQADAV